MNLNRIKDVLVEKGRSQTWLSESLDVSKAYVNELCANRSNPSLKRLFEIAEILGVPAYTLVGDYVKANEFLTEEEE